MKKTLVAWCLLSLVVQGISAQRSALYTADEQLYREAYEMYNDANFVGCIHKIIELKKTPLEANLLQESDWLVAASQYKIGGTSAGYILKEYLDNHPDSRHKNQAFLYIGSWHFAEGEYDKAIFWLQRANIDYLSLVDQDDYAYRMAYSSMKIGKTQEAGRLFGLLKANSPKYVHAATYYLAYLDYTEKNYQSALSGFTSLKGYPEYKQSALYYLVQLHYALGNNLQAIEEGETLLANSPYNKNNAEVHRVIGNAYFKEKNVDKAIENIGRYVSITENPDREDLYNLGVAYFEKGNYPSSILYLGKTTTVEDALTQNAYLYLGHAALKTGEEKSALLSFSLASRTSYDLKVKEAAAYNYAILLHQNSGSAFGESVTILENFLNEFPRSMYADRVNDKLVEVYLTTKEYQSALTSINKILHPDSKILEARQRIYYYLGTIDYTNMHFKEAIEWFNKCILSGNYAMQDRTNALYWRGDSYFRLGDTSAAIRDWKEFIAPGKPTDKRLFSLAHYNLGYAYFNQKDYEIAGNWFDRYLSMETDKKQASLADAYNRRGDVFFHNRQFSKAEEAYAQAAKLRPESGDYALFQMAQVLGLKQEFNTKLDQLDKLIDKHPESLFLPEAIFEKGKTYVLLGKNNEALVAYKDLVEQYPQSTLARKAGTQIGLLYFNQNKLVQSAEAYKWVIKTYPGSDESRVAMQDLKSVYIDLNNVEAYVQFINSLGGAKFEVSAQDSLTYFAAENLFIKGNEKGAKTALHNYLQSFPQGAFSIKAHYYLGVIAYNQTDFDEALTELNRVVEVGATEYSEDALLRIAYIELSKSKYEQALRAYENLASVAEKRENKITAYVGMMRSAYALEKPLETSKAANLLLKESNLSPEQTVEAKYYRALSLLANKEGSKAIADLKELGKDTRTAQGAEAKYVLAQYYFDTKQLDRAEIEVNEFIKSGTPHAYWLARGFVLLSDVYAAKGDNFQARQYLESLKHNYTDQDDISERIESRLQLLKN